jgi:hypothetical protein
VYKRQRGLGDVYKRQGKDRVQGRGKNISHGQVAVQFVDVSISPFDINIFAVLMLT